jgi:hypothetical protein
MVAITLGRQPPAMRRTAWRGTGTRRAGLGIAADIV